MPIKLWVDTDNQRVRAIVTGNFSTAEILRSINQAVEDPEFKPGFNILSDHTGIDTAITPEQAQMTAAHMEQLARYFTGSKWAVVTATDISYGMMRMLSVYLENIPVYLQVFRSMAEAEDWLSMP